MKTDSSGSIVWQKAYNPGGDDDSCRWIEATDSGDYVIAGSTNALDSSDALAIKLDGAGSILWQNAYNVSNAYGSEIHQSDNGFVVAGRTGYRGLLISVDENGDAPGADFIKSVNSNVYSTDATALDFSVDAVDTSQVEFDANAVVRTANAEIVSY